MIYEPDTTTTSSSSSSSSLVLPVVDRVMNIGLVEMDGVVRGGRVGGDVDDDRGTNKGWESVVVATGGDVDDDDNNTSFVSIIQVPICCNVLWYCTSVSFQIKSSFTTTPSSS